MELPPLNRFLAQQLMRRARVWRHLEGLPAAVHEQLEALLLRVSEMACELSQLREMDINPLLVDAFGLVAVDARVLLADQPLAPGSQPYRHLAIRPYPAQLSQSLPLRDGRVCQLRAIRPDDAAALQQLVAGLSPQSRYNRFAATLTELPPALLARFSLIDYEREMALVALLGDEIVGVARYTTNPGGRSAEFALLVADSAAGQGLGRRLMEALMAVAREQGLAQLDGLVLRQNDAMLKLVRGLGFAVQPYADEPDFRLVTHLL
ncbi:MAG: GNAT family N-acetyltransferase, partial [Inhella sp.]